VTHARLVLAALGAALLTCGPTTVAPPPSPVTDAGGSEDAGDSSSLDAGRDAGRVPDAGCHVDAGVLDPTVIAHGRAVIIARDCQKCHGSVLTGNVDGVMSNTALGGFAYPPNLTPDDDTGLGCWSLGDIARAVLHGVDNEGVQLCDPMPQFGDAGLPEADALAIAQFLRSIPARHSPVPQTPTCLAPDGGSVDAGASDAGPPLVDAGATEDAGDGFDGGVAADGGSVDAGDGSDASVDAGLVDAG
jgi:hypothetical protein